MPELPADVHRNPAVKPAKYARCQFRELSPGVLICDACGRKYKTRTPLEKVGPRRCRMALAGERAAVEAIYGVGNALHDLLESIGLKEREGCQCGKHRAQMNAWGPVGCREHRDTICSWLRDAFRQTDWAAIVKAASRLSFGLAMKLASLNPFGALVDEAIRRFEEKQAEKPAEQPKPEPAPPVVELETPAEPAPAEPQAPKTPGLIIHSRKGLGDDVMLTGIVRHLRRQHPDMPLRVSVRADRQCLFAGLGVETVGEIDSMSEDFHRTIPNGIAAGPGPLTGDARDNIAGRWLWERFDIKPDAALLRYELETTDEGRRVADAFAASLGKPFVLIHYEGASGRGMKNPGHEAIHALATQLRAGGYVPVLLDWADSSPLCGDALVVQYKPALSTLVALSRKAALCIGIDSGPGHVMQAAGVPTIIIWTGHHPLHFAPPDMRHVTHLLPLNSHQLLGSGDRVKATAWFRQHYGYEVYTDLVHDLPALAAGILSDEPPGPPKPRRPEITAIVPQGIGDVFWIHRLLHPHFDKVNYCVRIAPGHRPDVQRRMAGWSATWPGAGAVTFLEGNEGNYVEMMRKPFSVKELLARFDAGETTQEFCVNQFLEAAVPLEEIEPDLPVAWDFRTPQDWPHTLQMDHIPLPFGWYVCLYVCGDTRHGKPGGNIVWTQAQWVELITRIVGRHTPIILLGAPYDGDILSGIKASLEYDHGYFCDLRTNCGPAQALSIIFRSKLFVSYQSGLAIMADHWDQPQIKLYFDDERHRNLKWSWPKPRNRHAPYFHCAHFTDSPAQVAANIPDRLRIDLVDPHTAACLKWLPEIRGVEGDIAEMGVSRGRNLFPIADWALRHYPTRTVYALDTFQGLPANDFTAADEGTTMGPGAWSANESDFDRQAFRWRNIRKISGRVQHTLQHFATQLAFCWLDMDLYEPMAVAWKWLQTHTSPGAIVGIHDYGRAECPGIEKLVGEIDRRQWELIDYQPANTSIFFRRKT